MARVAELVKPGFFALAPHLASHRSVTVRLSPASEVLGGEHQFAFVQQDALFCADQSFEVLLEGARSSHRAR